MLFNIFVVFLLAQCINGQNTVYPLITEFSQKNCTDKTGETSYFYNIRNETQLPFCDEAVDRYKTCSEDTPCQPMYSCEQRCSRSLEVCTTKDDCPALNACNKMCVENFGSCLAYYTNKNTFNTTTYKAMFKPECLNDGKWAPKQCKGGHTGRCMCFDGNGNRIFGEALYTDSEDMTCACSRRKADIADAGIKDHTFLHCNSKGNYETLQCDGGQCWCAEPKTGDLTAPVVPESAMKYLPCFTTGAIGNQYLRQCESEKYAQVAIEEEMKIHGVTYSNFRYLVCDGDGAFGPYNVSESRPYCTWRDGTLIGSYQGNTISDLTYMNCNCARDLRRYGSTLQCTQEGNYKDLQPVQNSGQKYCVDTDGFIKSEIFPASTTMVDTDCDQYY